MAGTREHVEDVYDYIPKGIFQMLRWLRGREINVREYEEIVRREGGRLTPDELGFVQTRLRLDPGDWSNRPRQNSPVPKTLAGLREWIIGRQISVEEYKTITQRFFGQLAEGELVQIQNQIALRSQPPQAGASASRIGPQRVEAPTPSRDELGRRVREIWVEHAKEIEAPSPSHLMPWERLDEANKEVDRRIGERLWAQGYAAATHRHDVRFDVEALRAGMTQGKPFPLPKTMTVHVEAGHAATLEINGQPVRFVAREAKAEVRPGTSEGVKEVLGRTTDAIADLFIRNLVAIRKDDLNWLAGMAGETEGLKGAVMAYARAMGSGSSFACADTFDAMMRMADGNYDEDVQIGPVERRDFDMQLLRIAELVALDDPAEITNEPLTDAIIRRLEEHGRSPALGMALEQLRAVRRISKGLNIADTDDTKLWDRFWTWAEGFDMITEPALERVLSLSESAESAAVDEREEADGGDLSRIMQLLERAYISLEGAQGIGEALEGAWDDSLSMEAWRAWARDYKELAPLIEAAIGKGNAYDGQGRAAGNEQAATGGSGGGAKAEAGTNGSEAQRHERSPERPGQGQPPLAGGAEGRQPERHDRDAHQ